MDHKDIRTDSINEQIRNYKNQVKEMGIVKAYGLINILIWSGVCGSIIRILNHKDKPDEDQNLYISDWYQFYRDEQLLIL